MLIVIMLNVIMLSVEAPHKITLKCQTRLEKKSFIAFPPDDESRRVETTSRDDQYFRLSSSDPFHLWRSLQGQMLKKLTLVTYECRNNSYSSICMS